MESERSRALKSYSFQRVRCFLEIAAKAQVSCVSCGGGHKKHRPKNSREVPEHAPPENVWNLHFSNRWKCTLESAMLPACLLHISTGESPEQTRKLVVHEQIEHWPKFSASEGTNSKFMNTSKSLNGSYLWEKCQCVRNARVSVRAWDCIEMRDTYAQCVRLESYEDPSSL